MSVELISKGSYGCVYKGIKCNSKEKLNKGEISKLQVLNKFSLKEMRVSEKIVKKIKNYENYCAPIINSCETDLKEISEDVKDCQVLEDGDKFVLNKMKYVGDKTLIKKLFETKKSSSDRNFLRQYFDTYIKLFDSVKKLNDIGIIHMDLKGNNVMYLKGRPIIIDFGLSLDMDRIEKDKNDVFFVYAHDYEPWCIDLALITHIVTLNKEEEEIKDTSELNTICDNFIIHNTSIRANEKKKEDFRKKMREYIENYKGKKHKELYEDLLKGSKTWDIHSLVVMYFYFLFHGYVTGDSDAEKLEVFNNLPREIIELLDIQQEYIISIPGERDEKIKEKIIEQREKVLNMKLEKVSSNINSDNVIYKLLKKSYKVPSKDVK